MFAKKLTNAAECLAEVMEWQTWRLQIPLPSGVRVRLSPSAQNKMDQRIFYVCRRCKAVVDMNLDHVGGYHLTTGECIYCPGTFSHPRGPCSLHNRDLTHAHVDFEVDFEDTLKKTD